ncbi:unnamed protein product [Timema podura]|uniref:Biogenesis of lysosome-related organelles complex 1 subunit 3 n=1 Tax=Timema podura TaxID=61482 RepID=A0ABN7P0I5_TIMPD|nr:unnamed protein product [Timema podura]
MSKKFDSKHNTLLHRKLRERNISLHKNLLEFVHLSVSGPVRDLNTANHQLLQSQVTLQEAATTLHTLHKSLTLLSSRLSDITSSAFLSNIKTHV